MDLRQILGMLQGVSGPNGSGEYTARCPAHEDRTASLTLTEKESPKDGKRRIYMNCHAGCTGAEVMAALGISARDLIVNPEDGWKPGAGKGRKAGAGATKTQRKAAPMEDGPREIVDPETGEVVRIRSGNEERSQWGPDERFRMPDGTEARVRTVDEEGRPLDPATGEVIDGLEVNPGTGKLRKKTEKIGDLQVTTVGGKEAEKKPALEIDWDHPDAVYSYTNVDGTEVFQVVRYHFKNGPGKTFRQRRRATPEALKESPNAKVSRDGYISSVPEALRAGTLYHMPEVVAAIAAGKPVYVVEGEKDVETLRRLGYVATCNAGGADGGVNRGGAGNDGGSGNGAGTSVDGSGGRYHGGRKWTAQHSQMLAGADVIILPDCDPPPRDGKQGFAGQDHGWHVAMGLRGIAKRIRLVDLKAACPELPEKGDISDMVQLMGDTAAMDALARQVAATRNFDPQAVPFWLTPLEQAERLYGLVRGYGAPKGAICEIKGDETKALCDFVALPRSELTRDDGVTQSMYFVLDGWNSSGQKLGRVVIPAGDLDAMNWVTTKWGFGASVAPGSTTKGKVAWAIKKVGQIAASRITEYSHTGWRRIGGKLCYLYQGGAIGMDGVTVDLGDALKTYRLDGSGAEGFDRIHYADAAKVSLRIQKIMREEIGIALLGTMYLAPLREFLQATDVVPAFALYLYGESGTHKSTAAALALAHFGNFHAKNLPASFNDTGNSIGAKAFQLKDMPILVDDYHPVTSIQERRQMSATAQRLSRAFGDGADRGRLNADTSIKAQKPPRSVAVITGEDLPAVGASGLARFFILDIDKGDIPVGEELTEMQELARKGWLQRAMRGYILWLLKKADGLPDKLHGLFLQFRESVRRESEGQHDRAPETVACILIGYAMMLRYMQEQGVLTQLEAEQMLIHARKQLLAASKRQGETMASEKPTRIYLDSLGELISSGRVAVRDLTEEKIREAVPAEKMIGYVDQDYYYLFSQVAFGAVQALCREQGIEFPVTLKALYKHLKTDGVLPRGDGDPTRTKRFNLGDGKTVVQRVLWIPVEQISGPRKTGLEQQHIDFKKVDEPLPEQWKE